MISLRKTEIFGDDWRVVLKFLKIRELLGFLVYRATQRFPSGSLV